jgi:hypothetical protein
MSKIIVSLALMLTVAGIFQVLAEGRDSYRRDGISQYVTASHDEQPSPSPLTRFEQSLLAWGQLHSDVVDGQMILSPLTRFERTLLAWGQVQRAAIEPTTPSPLTRFEQSLLRWGQLQAEEQILS